VSTVSSSYCTDLVNPMVHTIHKVLETHVAKPHVVEKFVFVSESTLPLKPFQNVFQSLTKDEDSHLCFMGPKAWPSAWVGQARVFMPKHSQWGIITRRHAEKFAHRWHKVYANGSFIVQARPREMERRNEEMHFQHAEHKTLLSTAFSGGSGCADEMAVYSSLFYTFQPWALKETSLSGLGVEIRESPPLVFKTGLNDSTWAELSKRPLYMPRSRCMTFQLWQGSIEHRETCKDPELRKLFNAFAEDEMIVLGGAHSGGAHPYTFAGLTLKSLSALRSSPFLFGRKFAPELPDKGFYDTLIM